MEKEDSPFRGAGPNLDTYEPGHGLVGQPGGCSYCGSMEPRAFLDLVRAGAEVGPTDKSYKLYIKWGNPKPEKLFAISFTNNSAQQKGFKLWADMTPEEEAIALEHCGPNAKELYTQVGFDTRPSLEGKFYTPHFSREQGYEFRQLWVDKKIVWGYPGYSYRPLYLPGPSDDLS